MPSRSFRRRIASAAAVLTVLAVPATAVAAPTTVDLRIEGATSTLFEGRVTTDIRPFQFTGDPTAHECDGTAAGGDGTSPTPIVVRNNAVSTAMAESGLTATGTWYSFGASFDTIAGQSVAYDAGTNRYLVEYKNNAFASTGGCSDPISSGDKLLYAYGDGSEALLGLSGPPTATPGATVTLSVSDLGTAAPVAGAAVGTATSGADGKVTVGPLVAGANTFKATKSGAIRSNAVTVCATDGADGYCGTAKPGETAPSVAPCATDGHDGLCGTTDKDAPVPAITSVREGARFLRRHAPRTLAGRVAADPSGVKQVRVRLTRTDGPRCSFYDAGAERFVTSKVCGVAGGRFFSVGDRPDWSYLLPTRLARGRYVLDVVAVDSAGNVSPIVKRGRDRVVFVVR